MLSVHTLKSATQAAHYYEKGDYYVKGDEAKNNEWFGKGAEILGLTGDVDAKEFKALLQGRLLDGTILHGRYDADGKAIHRPGYDLTFSACKSASILALVGGDERIVKAHIEAVKTTLSKIESEMAATRARKNGTLEVKPTGNLAVAMFNHTDSRELDPNLHTHCVLLNITKDGDKWRTIYGDDFYNKKMALGLDYRRNFAQNLLKLGYEINQTSKDGLFEISGVPDDLIKHFSKRRENIEKILEESGKDAQSKVTFIENKGMANEKRINTVVSAYATLFSRPNKQRLTQDEMQQHWADQFNLSKYKNTDLENIINASKDMGPIVPSDPRLALAKAVSDAIDFLSDKKHLFSMEDLSTSIRANCLDTKISPEQIEREIGKLLAKDALIPRSGHFISAKGVNFEQNINKRLTDGTNTKSAYLPLVAGVLVDNFANSYKNTNNLKSLLASKDSITIVTSRDRSATVDVLSDFKKLTPHYNHYVISKNYADAKATAGNIGIEFSSAAHNFIKYTDKLIAEKSVINNFSVWIIDKSHDLNHKEISHILDNANKLGTRVLVVGNEKSIRHRNLNAPFRELARGSSTIQLNPATIDASKNLLDACEFKEVTSHVDKINLVTSELVSNKTDIVLVSNRAAARQMSSDIRDIMIAQGHVSNSRDINTLIPINFFSGEKDKLSSYCLGDVVRFNQSIQNTGLTKGNYYTIASIDAKNNSIGFEADGKTICTNFNSFLAKKISAYRTSVSPVGEGDRIRFNDFQSALASGVDVKSDCTVSKIDGGILYLKSDNGIKKLDISNGKYLHIEHNYTDTISNTKNHPDKRVSVVDTGNLTVDDISYIAHSLSLPPVVYCTSKQDIITRGQTPVVNVPTVPVKLAVENVTPNYCVDYALSKLSQREAVFSLSELKYLAYSRDVTVPTSDIDSYVTGLIDNALLILKDKDTVVHVPTYNSELKCLAIQEKGEGAVDPILHNNSPLASLFEQKSYLTQGQREAISHVLTTDDRVNVIQGVAGAGKTTMLKELKVLARENGFELTGISNTASAKNNLEQKSQGTDFNPDDSRTFVDAGISSHTLASFLLNTQKIVNSSTTIDTSNQILILDEASMVSAKDMEKLLTITEKLNMRIVMIGDERQLPAIEASRAFALLLGNAKNPITMNVTTRLKDENALSVMQDIYVANINISKIDSAFEKLQKNIVEVPDKNERLQLMAEYFANKLAMGDRSCMAMFPENKDRTVFNGLVREHLKASRVLQGEAITVNTLSSKDTQTADLTDKNTYQVGDVVRFNKPVERLGVTKGSYYTVASSTDEFVTLKSDEGKTISWSPFRHSFTQGSVEVYKPQKLELMIGDEIRWRRNFDSLGLVNSEVATITNLSSTSIEVRLSNSKTVILDVDKRENSHFDYAYGSTVHMAQGLDKENPIGLMDGPKPIYSDIRSIRNGDMIAIPGDASKKTLSKVGLVIETNFDNKHQEYIVALDREGNKERVELSQVQVYPDFSKAHHHSLSTINNFLVQATRGDNFLCFVDNVEGYKASLKASFLNLKKSALEIIDKDKGALINQKVKSVTSTVYGVSKQNTESKSQIKQIDNTSGFDFTSKGKSLHRENFSQTVLAVKDRVNSDPLGFAEAILGRAVNRAPSYASFAMGKDKSKGNLSLEISGSKLGIWCDHRTGEGGDLIALYATQYGLSYKDAVLELSKDYNISAINKDVLNISHKQNDNNLDAQKQREVSIKRAQDLYGKSTSIKNTPAEKYLKDVRGISASLPDDFRFSSRCWHKDLRTQKNALLFPGYDNNGNLQCVSRIYLEKTGDKLQAQYENNTGATLIATQKAVLGPSKGATVNVRQDESKTTYISEGVENALTIKQATDKGNIVACFGVSQIKNVQIPKGTENIIICADNDGKGSPAYKALQNASHELSGKGYNVNIVMPAEHKKDFNDIHREQGISAVKEQLQITQRTLNAERSL